ncbi:MAG: S4 domain-containing protein, partial [Alphaproteobacteria bacterium]
MPRDELDAGIALFALMARAGLAASNSEARRLIKGGGARVNDEPVREETHEVGAGEINADGVIKLSAGKKRHALIKPV